MILTELHTADIPQVYQRFADVVGDSHWRKRVSSIKQEIKGNRFLRDYLIRENSIAFQLDHFAELTSRHGRVPAWEINNSTLYPAASFAAQVLSFIDASPGRLAEQFRRRVQGALKNPDDMRGLRLEFAAATHFLRRRKTVRWPEMTGEGTFDLLISDVGPNGLEVECKSISGDKGRKIHQRESLEFFSLLQPSVQALLPGLRTGLSAVITVPARLPTSFRDRQNLARESAKAIFHGQASSLPNGCAIRFNSFAASQLGIPYSVPNADLAREVVDSVSGTSNRPSLVIGTQSGGAIAVTVQSAADDSFLETMFNTIKDSASRQLTGTRGGMFFVGMHGINDEQLNSLAAQDMDPAQSATALRVGVSRFLAGTGRDQVIGVGFLSEGGFTPRQNEKVSSGGTAYYFPKAESPFWSDDFSGLFAWDRSGADA